MTSAQTVLKPDKMQRRMFLCQCIHKHMSFMAIMDHMNHPCSCKGVCGCHA